MTLVSLRVICKEVKLPPKVARARLRNAKPGELPKAVGKRWAWSEAKAPKVKKFLKAA